MKNLGMILVLAIFAMSTLMMSGCKEALTVDQQAKLEETRLAAEKSEKDLSVKKKERLELEAQVKEGEE